MKSCDFVNSVEPPQTNVSKYLHCLSTLSSSFASCLIAAMSQGLPTNAKLSFVFKASSNLLKGEAGPYLDLLSQFSKSSFE